MMVQRLEAVRQKLSESRLDAFLVTHLSHVKYLTGFTGTNGLCVITREEQSFVTDSRYKSQAPEEVTSFRILIARGGLLREIGERSLLPKKSRVGFEATYLSVAELGSLRKCCPSSRLVPTTSLIEPIVSKKSQDEIGLIRTAVEITDKVFQKILSILNDSVSEHDVAAEISYWHRKFGAEADAFEPIVASGERGALPHARASEKRIKNGEMVTLDFGCRYKGYHSDLTRTVAVGSPSREMKKVYGIVLDAQQKAIESAHSRMFARKLDAIARKEIRKNGYGRFFSHSLGHGLGMEVHEMPRVSSRSNDILDEGNVITIEPGIYVPNVGGVRIEDDVVIRREACEVLNSSSKDLITV